MLIYFYVYKSTQDQISTLTQINLTTIINEVKTKSSNKLQETKSILENSAYYIANSEILNNDNDLIRFLSAIENMDDAVDTIQFMSEKNNLYLKGVIYRGQEAIDIEKKLHNLQNRPLPLEKPWYVKTKQENQTTTNIMEIHGLYGEGAIKRGSIIEKRKVDVKVRKTSIVEVGELLELCSCSRKLCES